MLGTRQRCLWGLITPQKQIWNHTVGYGMWPPETEALEPHEQVEQKICQGFEENGISLTYRKHQRQHFLELLFPLPLRYSLKSNRHQRSP